MHHVRMLRLVAGTNRDREEGFRVDFRLEPTGIAKKAVAKRLTRADTIRPPH